MTPSISALARFGLFCAVTATAHLVADEVRIERDVSYLETGRKEKLDLYFPARQPSDPPAPAAIWIHGGGWIGGNKAESRAENVCGTLVAAGYVCASVDYRLGDGSWPTDLFDCKNAVRFLRVNAAKFRLDPRRVAVLGGSAGGHLALMVGFTPEVPELEPAAPYPGVSDAVAAVVDLYGPNYPLAVIDTPANELAFGRVFGLPYGADPARARRLSPAAYVTAAAPPVLILHGLADDSVPYGQSLDLAKALAEEGVGFELIGLKNVGHSFDLVVRKKKPLPRDLRPDVLTFLRQALSR